MALASLASLIASTTNGPEQVVTLTCSGTETTWRAEVGTRSVLPWSRTYTIYLKAKRFCETRCRANTYLDTTDGSQLILGDLGYGPGSTRIAYKAADNSLYGHQVVSFGQRVSSGPASAFHLETAGTCKLVPGATAASAAFAAPSAAAAPSTAKPGG